MKKFLVISIVYLSIGFINAGFTWSWWGKNFCPYEPNNNDIAMINTLFWPFSVTFNVMNGVYTNGWEMPFYNYNLCEGE